MSEIDEDLNTFKKLIDDEIYMLRESLYYVTSAHECVETEIEFFEKRLKALLENYLQKGE